MNRGESNVFSNFRQIGRLNSTWLRAKIFSQVQGRPSYRQEPHTGLLGQLRNRWQRAAIFLLGALTFSNSFAKEPGCRPPDPEEIAKLFEFSGSVTLTRNIASQEDLKRAAAHDVAPLSSFSYSDPTCSSDSITVAVYAAGTFFGAKRGELNEWVKRPPINAFDDGPSFGISRTADGRPIYQFPLGFGPGGSSYGALLPCRDARYELVIIQATDFHDDEDPKAYSDHASPKRHSQSVIEAVEHLVFP